MLGWWRSLTTRKRVRAIVIGLSAVVVLWALLQAASALVPFLLGLLLAYLLYPLVQWLERHMPAFLRRGRVGRTLAIVVVYALGLGALVGFAIFVVPAIVDQFEELLNARLTIIERLTGQLRAVRDWYEVAFALQFRRFVADQLRNLSSRLTPAIQQGLVGGVRLVGNFFAVLAGFVIIPFRVFFVLLDAQRYQRTSAAAIPAGLRDDVLNLGRITDHVLRTYLAGQLIAAAITGALTGIGLALVGVNLAFLLGLLTAIGDLIPTLGPILAAIPTIIIAAIERPIQGLWALLILLGVQQLEQNTYGPRIVGSSVRLSPAVLIVLLVVGGVLWGFWGLVFIVPLAAVLRDMVRYVLIRTSSEQITAQAALAQLQHERQEGG